MTRVSRIREGRGGRALLLSSLLLLAPLAARAQVDARFKLQAGSEVDTNALRRAGEDRRTDGATRWLLRASVAHYPDARNVLYARLNVGVKLFFHEASEDLFITSGLVTFQHRLASRLYLAVDGHVKDRRERVSGPDGTDYFLAGGGLSLRWDLARRLSLRGRVGYGGFLFKPDDLHFGYQGDEYGLTLSAYPARRVRLSAGYGFARRSYRSAIFREVPGAGGLQVVEDPGVLRGDQVHSADVRVRFVRRILVEAGYSFQAVHSNSFGFTYLRHRFSAQVSARLPGDFFAHAAGALQFLSFRDPVFLDTSLFIEDDNRNWVAFKISREVGKGFAIEARYAFYASTFVADVLFYRRHVAGIGVAYTL